MFIEWFVDHLGFVIIVAILLVYIISKIHSFVKHSVISSHPIRKSVSGGSVHKVRLMVCCEKI